MSDWWTASTPVVGGSCPESSLQRPPSSAFIRSEPGPWGAGTTPYQAPPLRHRQAVVTDIACVTVTGYREANLPVNRAPPLRALTRLGSGQKTQKSCWPRAWGVDSQADRSVTGYLIQQSVDIHLLSTFYIPRSVLDAELEREGVEHGEENTRE